MIHSRKMKSKVAVQMKIMYYAMSRKNDYTVVALHCEEIVNPWYFLSIKRQTSS